MEKTRSSQIQEIIRNLVLADQEYKPGDKLPNENILSHQFGVSRPVIREALKALVAQGVLETHHGSGTFVTENPGFSKDPLGFSDIQDKSQLLRDWYETRRVIESEAIRMVVEKATEEDIEKLKNCALELEFAIQSGDSAFLKNDRKFHILMAAATHNSVMERVIIVLMRSFYYSITDQLPATWINSARENSLINHQRIMQSIIERDEVGASLAIRSHMTQALKDLDNAEDSPKLW